MTPSPPAEATGGGGGTKKGASGRNRKRPAATKKKQQFNVLENDVDLIKASSSAGGYYALQFQDDKTGRKNIHPSAMRFALRIMEEEAQLCTKSVAQSLVENSELVSIQKVKTELMMRLCPLRLLTVAYGTTNRKKVSEYKYDPVTILK